MPKQPRLSVVLPCYNEASNIKKGVLEQITSYLFEQSYSWELIVVDDGSTDGSLLLLREFCDTRANVILIENAHSGKARAVTSGVLAADGTYILFSDFDQATPIDEVEKILPNFSGNDIVIGSRKSERSGAPYSRQIMARGFMLLRNIVLGVDVEDTQCGFKAFKRTVARKLFKNLRLYRNRRIVSGSSVTAGFDVELLFLARKKGYSIKEVPVVWRYVETKRVNPIKDSIEGLRDLLRIKMHDIMGLYS